MDVRESELGRLLAAAHGYQVLSAEGRSLGVIERVSFLMCPFCVRRPLPDQATFLPTTSAFV
jgi:hypothetical protein